MTDTAGTISTQAGWYPDPSGAARQRWWDGARWTEHLIDPAAANNPAARVSLRDSAMPVYSASIWMIVGLPLLSLFALVAFDLTGFLIGFTSGLSTMVDLSVTSWLALLNPDFYFLYALALAARIASLIFSYVDWRGLRSDGIDRPFHWAWSFLSVDLYVLGRSIVVRRRVGRGLLPIGVMVLLWVVSYAVVTLKVEDSMPAVTMWLGSL
ncbi:DUF2510 domain-containing protein [Cryobacterium sp. Sr8]|uniref:DUF2510 domain-containing protein n=1 Tax=Cryobacterium sp. Sr8 TaxID=1259203 RepID=UPI00141B511A|nr:DUF2510 domain-containing protein [Cryobacterium sp. Sr8]